LILKLLVTYFSTLSLELFVSTFSVWIGGGDGGGEDPVLIKIKLVIYFTYS